MINHKPVHINKWLLPLSWLYGLVIYIRNKLFDFGILNQTEFNIPIICVGNITVGGTGKTPHIEFLIKILKDKYRVGVLSRGYKRKSKGFVLATHDTNSNEIGDESFQIKHKYPDVIVAVDANRRRGINKLLSLENPPQVILLDDAFQHRYVKPSFTILLSNFNRPVYEDALLPAGRLREPVSALKNANMVIVTKCPSDLLPIDYRIISHDINIFPYQELYFTTFDYKDLKPVFVNSNNILSLNDVIGKSILLVTGIASPNMIIDKLSEYTDKVEIITYTDHFAFSSKNIQYITDRFKKIDSENKLILVTEKDAARLIHRKDIEDDIKKYLYYLPIEVSFMDRESDFEEKIFKHLKDGRFRLRYK